MNCTVNMQPEGFDNFRRTGRKEHPKDTVIKVGDTWIGRGNLTIIAGPCTVESEEQVLAIAKAVKRSGATLLRGGAFKARTSPYSFQGMGPAGLSILTRVGRMIGMPVVSEITDSAQLSWFEEVDVIQVGARNMQNYSLLKELGRQEKPILLKRGMSATYEEWLMSAEYIMSEGNEKVILCERGIRTFENETRNTLDLTAVPVMKQMTHLPLVVDPSHATGRAVLVPAMAKAAVAAGADGVMIEVHNDPQSALCDGEQSMTPERFDSLCRSLQAVHDCI